MRRRFKRPLGERRYRKLFVLAVEGGVTEPQYFKVVDRHQATVRIKCLRGKNGSAPQNVLQRMNKHIKEEGVQPSDEAWIVVDKDQWTDDQLQELYRWSEGAENRGLAVSNPMFEYWLLLHFEDGKGIRSARNCIDRLKRHLPNYDKHVDSKKITLKRISEAIIRAKAHDVPPCASWPKVTGTTVYKLVENIQTA